MLVTLLVIWVVVIPALTVIGTYVASGFLRRRSHVATSMTPFGRVAERIDSCPAETQPSSARPHGSRRTRGHALAGR